MSLAEKRQEMVLAHRIEGDIPDDYQFIAVFGGIKSNLFFGVLLEAGKGFLIKICDPLRSFCQPFALDILADPIQDQPDALYDFFLINRIAVFFPGLTPICRLRR